VEQRLQAAEQENLESKQNLQRIDGLLQSAWNQLQGAEQHLQITTQQLREFQQQFTEADSQIKTFGPQIKRCEQRLEENSTQLAEMKSMFEEQTKRRENVEISIGELARDIGQFKAQYPKLAKDYEGLKSFQAIFRSNQLMQQLAVIASFASLLILLYIGLGKPGWPILSPYLSPWLPGLG
jgi:chromosome segregation ATPase